MKRHITFPSTMKTSYCFLVLCLSALIAGLYLYPKAPQQLTLYDNNQQVYSSQCPALSPVKASYPQGEKTLNLPFTLLNWNIYKQQREQWQKQLQEWIKNSDIVTLQEVKDSPTFNQFNNTNGLFYLQNYAFKYKDDIYGVNTLSQYRSHFICGTRVFEPWIRVPKTGLASIYPINNSTKPLLVINFHGVNFTFTAKPLIQQIQPYLELIATHKGPVIFAGDFNTWSQSRLNDVDNLLRHAGLTEVAFANDRRTTRFTRPLDHLYFRGLKVINAESLATDASDHTPQLVTFAKY